MSIGNVSIVSDSTSTTLQTALHLLDARFTALQRMRPSRERCQHRQELCNRAIMSSLFATARVWDDGIIDPRDTREVLAFVLRTIEEGDRRRLRPNSFGVARF